jgi:hypothetical protein
MATAVYTIYLGSRNPTAPNTEREITRQDLRGIEETVRKSFDAYTIVRAEGFWGGQREDSVLITVSALNSVKRRSADARIRSLCQGLIDQFKQLAVFVSGGQNGLLLTPRNVHQTGVVTTAPRQAKRTNWAKEVIDSVRKGSRASLRRGHAVAKLASFVTRNPNATKSDGIAELRRLYPSIPL